MTAFYNITTNDDDGDSKCFYRSEGQCAQALDYTPE